MTWLPPKNSMSSSARRPNWRAVQRPVSRPSASIMIASPCATPASGMRVEDGDRRAQPVGQAHVVVAELRDDLAARRARRGRCRPASGRCSRRTARPAGAGRRSGPAPPAWPGRSRCRSRRPRSRRMSGRGIPGAPPPGRRGDRTSGTPASPAASPTSSAGGGVSCRCREVPGTNEDIAVDTDGGVRWSMSSTCQAPSGHRPGTSDAPPDLAMSFRMPGTSRSSQPGTSRNTTTSADTGSAVPNAHHCRACGAPLTETFVDLGMSPLCESYLERRRSSTGWSPSTRCTCASARVPARPAAGRTSRPRRSSPTTPTSRRTPTRGSSTRGATPSA